MNEAGPAASAQGVRSSVAAGVARSWPWIVALCALGVLRLALAAHLPLVEDEAYYWEWSRHLAAGYFDHPPGIAWLIALGAPLGRTELAVRIGPVLAGLMATALLALRARDPLRFVLLVAGVPLFALGGILATPDVPLLLGWAVATWALLDRRWIWVGIGVGIAGLGKYSGWGFWPLAMGVAAFDSFANRRSFLPDLRGVRMGVAATLLVLAPNLVWNFQHDWSSIKFQVGHGLNRPPAGALAFFGAQVGLAGPLLFGVFGAWCIWISARIVRVFRGRSGQAALATGESSGVSDWPAWHESVTFALSAPVIGFFTFAATRGSGEANWAAPAYFGAVLALANATGRWARAAWVAAGVGLGITLLVTMHLVHPIAIFAGDPTARLGLGRDLAKSVQAWNVAPVYTSRYQEAAMISFYGGIEAYALPGVDRTDQYDLWPTRWASPALFVRTFKGGPTTAVDPFCPERGGGNVVSEYTADGKVLQRWQVYEVSGCGPRQEVPNQAGATP